MDRVWIEFKGHRRALYDNPLQFPFKAGDFAIVEAERGIDAGQVKAHHSIQYSCSETEGGYRVIRPADAEDLQRIEWLGKQEASALAACRSKVLKHKLPMKVIDAEYRFDGNKLNFHFTADGRLDFRALVRDLATTFCTRIELRQIGARDEFKRCGGFGICGNRLCCAGFLNSFQPITTQMVKNQHLILNPSKLSGPCGRLKCCLGFECEHVATESYMKQFAAIDVDDTADELDSLSD